VAGQQVTVTPGGAEVLRIRRAPFAGLRIAALLYFARAANSFAALLSVRSMTVRPVARRCCPSYHSGKREQAAISAAKNIANTTSVFMRPKLGAGLAERNVAPHIFETSPEAQAFSAAQPRL
jgi:hypothetical protein